jgi:hypothetical protein
MSPKVLALFAPEQTPQRIMKPDSGLSCRKDRGAIPGHV